MDGDCAPTVHTHTLTLDLFPFDRAFAQPLFASLVVLAKGAVLVSVGGPDPLPFSWAKDSSVAMPRPNGPPSATSLGNASASTTLAARLAKRYTSQVFLTLDLASLAQGAGGPAAADRAVVPMEKALVAELDKVLERRKP
ncbi:hypothetical protein DMC30DRAFT_418538 [Rhodotorula diobovata]|uniref:Proteasome assembly chaperone 3 n=1 Tax=Rhodotorula diobovata TaxID=5288 RepID=A0A5C5FRB3_9BASI|nr:hypothetical protein DMC30DRAFT_418538 [Rhodotorula diobovata]